MKIKTMDNLLAFLLGWIGSALMIFVLMNFCVSFHPLPSKHIHHLTTGVVIAKWVDINSTGCYGICPQDILELAKGWQNVSETTSWQFRDDSGSWVRTKSVGRKGTKVDVWEYLKAEQQAKIETAQNVFWSNFVNEIEMRIN